MQSNPAVEQSKIIRWSESPWNQSGRKGKVWNTKFSSWLFVSISQNCEPLRRGTYETTKPIPRVKTDLCQLLKFVDSYCAYIIKYLIHRRICKLTWFTMNIVIHLSLCDTYWYDNRWLEHRAVEVTHWHRNAAFFLAYIGKLPVVGIGFTGRHGGRVFP